MKRLSLFVAGLMLSGCATMPAGSPQATAELKNARGEAVGTDRTARLEYVTKLVTLGPGPTSLFDADGSALVIHANPDDETTDPTGNSGGRIACGVITKSS